MPSVPMARSRTSRVSVTLDLADYDAIRGAHRQALKQMAASFGKSLGEKGAAMHFQRLVGALVSSVSMPASCAPTR
jgi:hypothetical protein